MIRWRIIVIIIVTTTVACAAVGLALNSPRIYVAKFELLTESITAEDKVVRDDRSKTDDNKIDVSSN